MAKRGSSRPGSAHGGSGRSNNARYARTSSRGGKNAAYGQRARGASAGSHGARGGRSARGSYGHGGPARRPGGKPQASYIEGRRACAEALEADVPLRRALVSSGELDETLQRLVARLHEAGVPVEQVPRARLDQLSSHGAHQGIIVQAEPYKYAELDTIIERAGKGPALVVLLDHVTDEGNFGAIVRSAEVVGAAGVVIAKARAAGVGTATYKTSAGAVMHLPIAQVSNLGAAIDKLKEAGFWVGGASEHAHDDVWHAPLGGRVCLVMGSEGSGISSLVQKKCDFTCRLPQRGHIESLNVAQAATVMCYEWLRRQSLAQAEE